jgi:hypothetical protein
MPLDPSHTEDLHLTDEQRRALWPDRPGKPPRPDIPGNPFLRIRRDDVVTINSLLEICLNSDELGNIRNTYRTQFLRARDAIRDAIDEEMQVNRPVTFIQENKD